MPTIRISPSELQGAARTLRSDSPTLLTAARAVSGAGGSAVGGLAEFPQLAGAVRQFTALHGAALTTAAGAAESYAADVSSSAVLAQQSEEDTAGLFRSVFPGVG